MHFFTPPLLLFCLSLVGGAQIPFIISTKLMDCLLYPTTKAILAKLGWTWLSTFAAFKKAECFKYCREKINNGFKMMMKLRHSLALFTSCSNRTSWSNWAVPVFKIVNNLRKRLGLQQEPVKHRLWTLYAQNDFSPNSNSVPCGFCGFWIM